MAIQLTNMQMMEQYQAIATVDCDPELPLQKATAKFSCLQGKGEMIRMEADRSLPIS